jgi:hypothetical protein
MENGAVEARGWQLGYWVAVLFAVLTEAQMAGVLFNHLTSYFLTSTYHEFRLLLFISAMVL